MDPFPIDYSDEWDSKTTHETIILYDTVIKKIWRKEKHKMILNLKLSSQFSKVLTTNIMILKSISMLNNIMSVCTLLAPSKKTKEPKNFWKEYNSLLWYVRISNYSRKNILKYPFRHK